MFTGIIERTLRVIGVVNGPKFRRLTLSTEWTDVSPGASIAVNGCCLTVAELAPGELGFDVIAETLAKTNLGLLTPGDHVNVERSLRAGDRIDGHYVQGHVEATGRLVEVIDNEHEVRLVIEPPRDLLKFIIPKGSIAIDGVSLTVAAVKGFIFEVALIPTTLALTNLASRSPGWLVNLETDILSRTVVSWLERTRTGGDSGTVGLASAERTRPSL